MLRHSRRSIRYTGSDAAAQASFITIGDQLTIRITATGVPPSMEHLQHFHGFVDNDQQSKCPVADNDLNGDGVIDIKETEARAGTTVVPFQGDPVGMEVVADTYPTADAGGTYSYEKTVPLQALQEAFASKFGGPAARSRPARRVSARRAASDRAARYRRVARRAPRPGDHPNRLGRNSRGGETLVKT